MDFRFTRHALSCNNIEEGEIFGKDYEPGLSTVGIIETAMFAQENSDVFDSYDVCVSNLHRTWCTAFILYGTNMKNKNTILNLWICPYLKEKVKDIIVTRLTRGNYPKKIQHMASQFLKFLQVLYKIKEDHNFIRKIKDSVDNSNDKTELKKFLTQWYNSLPDEIILRFPTQKYPTKYSEYTKVVNNIIYKKDINGKYIILKNCVKDDFISENSKTNKEQWLKDGDLNKFMNWYNNLKPPMFNSKRIHVITHSGIMRKYLGTLGINVKAIKEKDKDETPIGKTNCWTFVTNQDVVCLNNIDSKLKTKKEIIETLSEELHLLKKLDKTNIQNIQSIVNEQHRDEQLERLYLLMLSLKKGVTENPLAKKIEKKSKKENMSLCSNEENVQSAQKTPISCLTGMEGGTKRRKSKRRKTRRIRKDEIYRDWYYQ